jgi:alpha-galactosidase
MIKLAFIGAGSTIFMKNIVGDMLHFEALRDAEIALMDIDPVRLDESRMVAEKMIATMGTGRDGRGHNRPRPRARRRGFRRDRLPDRRLPALAP